MRVLQILLALSLGALGCSKDKSPSGAGLPGQGLPELTGQQQQEVASVSGAVGDMSSIGESKVEAPGFNKNGGMVRSQSQTLSRLATIQLTESQIKEKSQKRLEKAQQHLDDPNACTVDFNLNGQDFASNTENRPGPWRSNELSAMEDMGMSFELLIGGPKCDISLSSLFDMEFSSAGENQVRVGLQFETKFETRGVFQTLFEVQSYQLSGSSDTVMTQVSETGGNVTSKAQFLGTGLSTEKGQFQVNLTMDANLTTTTSDGPYHSEASFQGTMRSVVSYTFPDFQAVLVTDGLVGPSGEFEFKYYMNGKQVDPNDDEAIGRFQDMVNGIVVPESSLGMDGSQDTNYGSEDDWES